MSIYKNQVLQLFYLKFHNIWNSTFTSGTVEKQNCFAQIWTFNLHLPYKTMVGDGSR